MCSSSETFVPTPTNLKLMGRSFSYFSSFIRPKAYLSHVGQRHVMAAISNKVGPTGQGHEAFDSRRERKLL